MRAYRRAHTRLIWAVEETEARADRLEAFPDAALHNDFEIPHHFAFRPGEPELYVGPLWVDSLRASRLHLHTLVRFTYQQGETYTVERLNEEREETAVLLSYALAVEDGVYPEHVEETRRREEETNECL